MGKTIQIKQLLKVCRVRFVCKKEQGSSVSWGEMFVQFQKIEFKTKHTLVRVTANSSTTIYWPASTPGLTVRSVPPTTSTEWQSVLQGTKVKSGADVVGQLETVSQWAKLHIDKQSSSS